MRFGTDVTRGAFVAGAFAVAARARAVASEVGSPYATVLARYCDAGKFDGVALVARGDTVLFRGAVGLADRESRAPHAVNEVFRIASITKQFTALMLMQEVEAGRLDLDAPIGRHLGALPADAAAITTRQLLKNVSGLPDLGSFPDAYTRTDVSLDDLPGYVRRLALAPLVSVPGTKFTYNNLDFIVAGAVLQSVTGSSFGALLQRRIVEKLGLRSTGLYGATVPSSHVRGYEAAKAELVPENIGGRLEMFGPAGAMYSTLDDMLRWDRALLGDTLLGREATQTMFTSDKAFGYVALGSWVYDLALSGRSDRTHLIERQGNIGGIQILNLLAPSDDLAMIVMANTDHADLFNTYSKTGLPYDLISLALTR